MVVVVVGGVVGDEGKGMKGRNSVEVVIGVGVMVRESIVVCCWEDSGKEVDKGVWVFVGGGTVVLFKWIVEVLRKVMLMMVMMDHLGLITLTLKDVCRCGE